MKLFYRKIGEGKPLIILHGLFGQSDNWNSIGKQLSELGYAVYLVDVRNHGQSPHSDSWNYQVMSDDVLELINDCGLSKNGEVILLGHSMGGKVAMQFAIDHQKLLDKLIIVDIAPKYYQPHHQNIIKGLLSVDLNQLKTRKEADAILSEYIQDIGTKQFLLKNLYRNDDTSENEYSWRFNLEVISSQIETIGESLSEGATSNTPTLFIKGSKSNYIHNDDLELIQKVFPKSILETIDDAGHWLHAEKPKAFLEAIIKFI